RIRRVRSGWRPRAGRGFPPPPSRTSSTGPGFLSAPSVFLTSPDAAQFLPGAGRREPSMLILVLLFQARHYTRIGQRGRIPKCFAFCNIAQEAAHDLARPGLGQVGGEDDVVGPRD